MKSPFNNDWKVGRRVSRPDDAQGGDTGTIVAIEGEQIKVKWDGGRTSYYDMRTRPNIQLDIVRV